MTLHLAERADGPELPHQQVAKRLRGFMAENQITGTAMAAALGMDQRNFSRRYRGITPFTFNELSLLAQIIGMPFADLVAHAPVENDENPRPVEGEGSSSYTPSDSNREPADYRSERGPRPLVAVERIAPVIDFPLHRIGQRARQASA